MSNCRYPLSEACQIDDGPMRDWDVLDDVNFAGAGVELGLTRRTMGKVPSPCHQTPWANLGPPIDLEKIANIRIALFRGDYTINSRAIADAIARQAHL
ncbi:MAG: hypothetical protein RL764_1323 [Pseudomonadota bacterium]